MATNSRATLATDVASKGADNTAGDITAQDLRELLTDANDSAFNLTDDDSDDVTEGATNLFLTSAERSKLSGIEAGATGDQTGAEIKTAYEGEANTNAYTDAEQTKVGFITVTQAVNLDTMESDISTNATNIAGKADASHSHSDATTGAAGFMSAADKTKLDGIEASATADQTGAEIKTLYEAEADTNAFTDADHTKLDGIEAGAQENYADVSGAEMTAGTETGMRSFSPANIVTMIGTHETGGGGGGLTWNTISTNTTASVGNGYHVDDADITLTLPASPSLGEEVQAIMGGTSILTVSANTGQTIHFGTENGTDLESTSAHATLRLVAIASNTWVVMSSVGVFKFV